jgi:transposase
VSSRLEASGAMQAVQVDAAALSQMLERIAPRVASEDLALIKLLVEMLLGVVGEVREKGATISRLRRLVGMAGSEKTAVVLARPERGDEKDAGGNGGGATPADAARDVGEPIAAPPPALEGKANPTVRQKRKGHGRLGVADYPRALHTPVPHESLHPGDPCPNCPSGRLHPVPPVHWLQIVGQPPLQARCSCLERLRCSPCGVIFTAKAPEAAQGPKVTASAVAEIAMMHYMGGMPFHRLEALQQNLQTPLPAATQWEMVAEREAEIRCILEELKKSLARADALCFDDTRGPVLEFMGKRRAVALESGKLPDPARFGLNTTGLVASDELDHPMALFITGHKHAGENVAEILKLRPPELPSPLLMCDALAANAPRGCIFVQAHCLAHARRNFVDELTNHPQECRHVLEQLERVFAVEARSRRDRLSPQQRLELHERESGPVMDELAVWMRDKLDQRQVEPNSGLGRAINYMLKRWATFTVFLRVAGAPLQNNVVERALKAAIRHRRNSLFYRSEKGARVGDAYMSLLYTAELNGENPFAYLTALLSHPADVAKSPADWLPWNYRATIDAARARAQAA